MHTYYKMDTKRTANKFVSHSLRQKKKKKQMFTLRFTEYIAMIQVKIKCKKLLCMQKKIKITNSELNRAK